MKNKLMIVVGPHGVGKTHLTDYIRDNLESCNLYRLSGHADKTANGLKYSQKMYEAFFNYLESMAFVPVTILLDSFFMTEELLARLGEKDYSFTEDYYAFLERLNALEYEIYYIELYLENTDHYQKRIQSRKHHNYFPISAEKSVKEQKGYEEITKEVEAYSNIHVIRLAMDDYDKAYEMLSQELKLGDKDENA